MLWKVDCSRTVNRDPIESLPCTRLYVLNNTTSLGILMMDTLLDNTVIGKRFDCDTFERVLRVGNILLVAMLLVTGMMFCKIPLSSLIAYLAFYFFLPVNTLIAFRRRGIVCQIILLISTLFFPLYTWRVYFEVFYALPSNPQDCYEVGCDLIVGFRRRGCQFM